MGCARQLAGSCCPNSSSTNCAKASAATGFTGPVCGASLFSGIMRNGVRWFALSMKILRSTHTVNPALGGPIEAIRQSSAALLRRGHEVEIISLDAPDDPCLRDFAV